MATKQHLLDTLEEHIQTQVRESVIKSFVGAALVSAAEEYTKEQDGALHRAIAQTIEDTVLKEVSMFREQIDKTYPLEDVVSDAIRKAKGD